MRNLVKKRAGFAWLELLLLLALVALVLQLLSNSTLDLVETIDVRNWTSRGWFLGNAVLFLSMILVRFGPGSWKNFLEWARQNRRISTTPDKLTKEEKRRKYEEERAVVERIKEARRKRIY